MIIIIIISICPHLALFSKMLTEMRLNEDMTYELIKRGALNTPNLPNITPTNIV